MQDNNNNQQLNTAKKLSEASDKIFISTDILAGLHNYATLPEQQSAIENWTIGCKNFVAIGAAAIAGLPEGEITPPGIIFAAVAANTISATAENFCRSMSSALVPEFEAARGALRLFVTKALSAAPSYEQKSHDIAQICDAMDSGNADLALSSFNSFMKNASYGDITYNPNSITCNNNGIIEIYSNDWRPQLLCTETKNSAGAVEQVNYLGASDGTLKATQTLGANSTSTLTTANQSILFAKGVQPNVSLDAAGGIRVDFAGLAGTKVSTPWLDMATNGATKISAGGMDFTATLKGAQFVVDQLNNISFATQPVGSSAVATLTARADGSGLVASSGAGSLNFANGAVASVGQDSSGMLNFGLSGTSSPTSFLWNPVTQDVAMKILSGAGNGGATLNLGKLGAGSSILSTGQGVSILDSAGHVSSFLQPDGAGGVTQTNYNVKSRKRLRHAIVSLGYKTPLFVSKNNKRLAKSLIVVLFLLLLPMVGACAVQEQPIAQEEMEILRELESVAEARPTDVSDEEIADFLARGLWQYPPKKGEIGVYMWQGPMRVAVMDENGKNIGLNTFPGNIIQFFLASLAEATHLSIIITRVEDKDNNASIVVTRDDRADRVTSPIWPPKDIATKSVGTMWGVPELAKDSAKLMSGLYHGGYAPQFHENYLNKACGTYIIVPQHINIENVKALWSVLQFDFASLCFGPVAETFWGPDNEPRVKIAERKHPFYFWRLFYNSGLVPGMNYEAAKKYIANNLRSER